MTQILSHCVSILYWRLPTWARLECTGLLLRICQTVSDRCATEKLVMIWASVNGTKLERGFSFIFLKNFEFRFDLGIFITVKTFESESKISLRKCLQRYVSHLLPTKRFYDDRSSKVQTKMIISTQFDDFFFSQLILINLARTVECVHAAGGHSSSQK